VAVNYTSKERRERKAFLRRPKGASDPPAVVDEPEPTNHAPFPHFPANVDTKRFTGETHVRQVAGCNMKILARRVWQHARASDPGAQRRGGANAWDSRNMGFDRARDGSGNNDARTCGTLEPDSRRDAKRETVSVPWKDHLERSGSQDGQSFLIVVRMSVAPLPITPLSPGVLPVVLTIGSVPNHEITSVRVVFPIVPVVVVTAVSIKDSNLHACLLRLRAGHGYRWSGKGRTQKQQAEVSIDITQDRFLPIPRSPDSDSR
jgi:hypothetical protein